MDLDFQPYLEAADHFDGFMSRVKKAVGKTTRTIGGAVGTAARTTARTIASPVVGASKFLPSRPAVTSAILSRAAARPIVAAQAARTDAALAETMKLAAGNAVSSGTITSGFMPPATRQFLTEPAAPAAPSIPFQISPSLPPPIAADTSWFPPAVASSPAAVPEVNSAVPMAPTAETPAEVAAGEVMSQASGAKPGLVATLGPAAVGFFVAGPIGAAVGFAAGRFLGRK